jgi:hypothetical protein
MKIKITLITLFLFSSIVILAQEKYEFCIIEYFPKKKLLSISKNGTEHSDELITYSIDSTNNVRCRYNANPLLEKVKLFQEKDWEVMNFNTNLSRRHKKRVYSAYLRRKIK